MTVPESIRTRTAELIGICDEVIERLAEHDSRTLDDLIADVRAWRSSLENKLASMNGDGSRPPT